MSSALYIGALALALSLSLSLSLSQVFATLSAAAHATLTLTLPPSTHITLYPPPRPLRSGWWRQFTLLLGRSWRQATRDKAANVARAGSSISSAVIFGAIFFRLPRTQTAIQDRFGLLQVRA